MSAPSPLARPTCYACGQVGRPLYRDLEDRLFGCPGRFHLDACPDPGCGLVWLNPRPSADELGLAYASYYTHAEAPEAPSSRKHALYLHLVDLLAARRLGYRLPVPAWVRPLGWLAALHPGLGAAADFSVMHLRPAPGARLLDVGCGGGELLQRMARLGWRVQGIDPDSRAVAGARRRGLAVELGTLAMDAPFAAGSFEAVTLSHAIEHVPDPRLLLRACARVLVRGGTLAMATPNVRSLGHLGFGGGWQPLDPPRHLHLFTPAALARIAREAGLDDVRVRTTVRAAEHVFVASLAIRRTGRYVWGTPTPLHLKLLANALQALEAVATLFAPSLGEEIRLLARKP